MAISNIFRSKTAYLAGIVLSATLPLLFNCCGAVRFWVVNVVSETPQAAQF